MGVSLHAYIIHQRLQQAREAIDQTDLPITDIAARLSYANVHYFSRQFTHHTGMTPTAYRQQHGR
jgi:AraC-like DNA-binding protein